MLTELFISYDANYIPTEIKWGPPVSKEEW
jgi:hypothetical protein